MQKKSCLGPEDEPHKRPWSYHRTDDWNIWSIEKFNYSMLCDKLERKFKLELICAQLLTHDHHCKMVNSNYGQTPAGLQVLFWLMQSFEDGELLLLSSLKARNDGKIRKNLGALFTKNVFSKSRHFQTMLSTTIGKAQWYEIAHQFSLWQNEKIKYFSFSKLKFLTIYKSLKCWFGFQHYHWTDEKT